MLNLIGACLCIREKWDWIFCEVSSDMDTDTSLMKNQLGVRDFWIEVWIF